MDKTVTRQACVHAVQDIGQAFLRLKVVNAVHEQQLRHGCMRSHRIAYALRIVRRFADLVRESLGIVVPEGHERSQNIRAVRTLPEELHLVIINQLMAAPEDRIVNPKLAQYLGHLRDVSELVRQIADLHDRAEVLSDAMAYQQAADR